MKGKEPMTPKQLWSQKLKKWQKDREEALAKSLMSPPEKTTILRSIPFPGVVVIMGARGKGKTGLAYEIMSQLHSRKHLAGAILYPELLPRSKRKVLPPWVSVVSSIMALPKSAVCIIDEAAQVAHARRSQSTMAVRLDNLVSISRHRRQLILFISHHSRKLDINLIHDSDRLLWKEPTEAHALFERDELQMFTGKALDFFAGIKGEKARLKATYIMDLHHMKFYSLNNSLPGWWCDTLSNGFQDFR